MTNKPKVTNLHIKLESGQPMRAKNHLDAVAGKGLEGDITFGRTSRQVLLVSEQILGKFNLTPGTLRENITVENLDVDALAPGTILSIGSTQLEITKPCEPCWKMDRIQDGLQIELQGQRGVLANVVQSGRISVDDIVSIQPASNR